MQSVDFFKLHDNYLELDHKLKIFKQMSQQFISESNINLQCYDLGNIDDSQQNIMKDICQQIINSVCDGKPFAIFDLQYTNPNRHWARPGPPKLQLNNKSYSWLKNNNFLITRLKECYGSSTSCDFNCICNDTTRIRINWNLGDINDSNINMHKFNADLCNAYTVHIRKFIKLFKTH